MSIKYLQVLDFFNSRMDAQRMDGDWSVNEVLQVIIVNCRSWRGDGMKVRRKKFVICGLLLVGNLSLGGLLVLFGRCLLNCASHMNKRAIQRSFLSHMSGSWYYPVGTVPGASFC